MKKSSPRQTGQKPEIRIDYIHDRQVIIAPGRANRPHNFVSDTTTPTVANDIFTREALRGQPLLLTVGGRKNWKICVKKNIFPVVSPDFPKAYGYQEVVIETPRYGVELASLPTGHVAALLRTYGQRVRSLQRDPRIRYILVFKNNGGRAGASINHAHSQIFASEYVPPHIVLRRERAQAYRVEHGSDYYSDLIIKEERGPRWIAGGKQVCALTPYASMYNYEAWIMPWRRVDNISQLSPREINEMAVFLKKILLRVNELGLPYNFYLHQVVADQSEHLYLRIAPRRDVWAGIELGSRLVVNTVPPEEAAKYYRTAFRK
jgi:UDPglucose--hexose-1-phosphate uridylyltransferase